jgi:hypothetical protein
MITCICDRCGRPLEKGDLRYVARIQVYAGYDPLEITEEDLQADLDRELREAMDQCEQRSEEDLMREVYVEFRFDLCPDCQQVYIANPLPEAD